MNANSENFIARRIEELNAVRDSHSKIELVRERTEEVQTRTEQVQARTEQVAKSIKRTTRWVVGGALAIAIILLGVALAFLERANALEDRVLAAIAADKKPATIEIQQWTSGPFVSGKYECAERPPDPKDKSDKPDPCERWFTRSKTGEQNGVRLEDIVSGNKEGVKDLALINKETLIFATGSHDKVALSSAAKAVVGSNQNLAYLRARAITARFRQRLLEARKEACNCDADMRDVKEEWSTRGYWDQKVQADSDRTVTITLIRREKSS